MRARRGSKDTAHRLRAGQSRLQRAERRCALLKAEVAAARQEAARARVEADAMRAELSAAAPPPTLTLPTFSEMLGDLRRSAEGIVWVEAQAEVIDARHLGALAGLLSSIDSCLEAVSVEERRLVAGRRGE